MRRLMMLVLLSGCGGAASTALETADTPASSVGDERSAPGQDDSGGDPDTLRLGSYRLPSLGRPLAEASEELRAGWALALPPLEMTTPEPPSGANVQQFNEWTSTTLTPWVSRRQQSTARGVEALQAAASTPPPDLLAAATATALLHVDFAEQLLDIPAPPTIAEDDELMSVYRGAIESSVEPLLAQGQQALEFCVARAEELGHADWLAYCQTQLRKVAELRAR